jgi:hypothetical protein
MGGPVCWGCTREKGTVGRSSCESEIYATDEGTKSVLTVRHLLQDLGFSDSTIPTSVWNDNRSCVDWTKGVTVSKKLRHINMRKLGVRQAQQDGYVDIRHIEGKHNIADLFTKEIKDAKHLQNMAFTITSPRLVDHMNLQPTEQPYVIEGGVKYASTWTSVMTSSWVPPSICQAVGHIRNLPTAILGRRAI